MRFVWTDRRGRCWCVIRWTQGKEVRRKRCTLKRPMLRSSTPGRIRTGSCKVSLGVAVSRWPAMDGHEVASTAGAGGSEERKDTCDQWIRNS